jgi:rod shape-determining protein MreC
MSYHQDNLRRTKNIRFAILLTIVGIIFYFSSGFILDNAYNTISFITSPVLGFSGKVKMGLVNLRSLLKSKQSLQADNDRLTKDLLNAKLELASLDLVKQENEDLMIQMGREFPETSRTILATVLSGPNIPPYESLIIDIGRDHDVSVGDRIIHEPNIVLGEVVQVFEQTSKVRLYSANGVITDILVPTEEPTRATAIGYGGGNFFIDLPNSITLEKGMQLLIPGSDIYILGTVDYIKIDPVTASQKVLVKYPVNIKNIRFVHVVKLLSNESR